MIRKILVLAALLLLLSVGTTLAQDDDDELDIDTAWQPFQHGVMMWFRDCDEILVMMSSEDEPLAGLFFWLDDNWESEQGNPSAEPPNRFLHTPRRGFGRIWQQSFGSVRYRDILGWGLAPELGYDSDEMDCDPEEDDEFIIDGPGDTVYAIGFTDDNTGVWLTLEIG